MSSSFSAFQNLPVELITEIVSNVTTARDLRTLSLCCHRFKDIISQVGWRDYVERTYPDFALFIDRNVDYASVARSLSALLKNLKHRALLAREISPTTHRQARHLQDHYQKDIPSIVGKYAANRSQRMGVATVLESHEQLISQKWNEREEVVLWTAGQHIIWRYRVKGSATSDLGPLNETGNSKTSWGVASNPLHFEGRDDYTALKWFGSIEQSSTLEPNTPTFSVFAGTASGELDLLQIQCLPKSSKARPPEISQSFKTGNESMIRSIDTAQINPTETNVLVSTYASTIHVFDIESPEPKASLSMPDRETLWDAKYLSPTSIVTGSSHSAQPVVKTYQLTPTGILDQPTREWPTDNVYGAKVVLPLPDSLASNHADKLFLVGRTDGSTALYDTRDSSQSPKVFWDSMDDGSVYSLVAKGHACFMVGMDKSTKLKLFDLRTTEVPQWQTSVYQPPPQQRQNPPYTYGWSLFLRPQRLMVRKNVDSLGRSNFVPSINGQLFDHAKNSPIYSLSTPSPYSPTIYAGLLSRAVQVDVADVFDPYPDPIYKTSPLAPPASRRFWDPCEAALELAGYDHQNTSSLYQQSFAWDRHWHGIQHGGLDRRWLYVMPPSLVPLRGTRQNRNRQH